MTRYDALIVGQGLAGSVLSRLMEKRGLRYFVVDQDQTQTSSKIAAGLVNPITGRRFAMSWKFAELNQAARPFYEDWQEEAGCQLIYDMPIVRAMEDRRFVDDVEAKTTDPYYQSYIQPATVSSSHYLKPAELLYQINQAYRVDIQELLAITKAKLVREDRIELSDFQFDDLEISEDQIRYRNIIADRIFFCEGSKVVNNPYFNYLPFQPTKGELFLLRQQNPHPFAYKQDLLVIPYPNDILWCGALNFWDYELEEPTTDGEEILLQKLRKMYYPDPYIEQHWAAIRPTTKDRRPMIGVHPQYPQLGIFNGLGTKGTLLAPYFGEQLLDSIFGNGKLMEQASIFRYT